MAKYEYVSVDYQAKEIVIASLSEHRDIIDQYARQGYKYAGMIPTEISAHGCLRKIDLIFEKAE